MEKFVFSYAKYFEISIEKIYEAIRRLKINCFEIIVYIWLHVEYINIKESMCILLGREQPLVSINIWCVKECRSNCIIQSLYIWCPQIQACPRPCAVVFSIEYCSASNFNIKFNIFYDYIFQFYNKTNIDYILWKEWSLFKIIFILREYKSFCPYNFNLIISQFFYFDSMQSNPYSLTHLKFESLVSIKI